MEKQTQRWILYQLLFLLFIFSFLNQFIYRYAVPAGGDAIGHNSVVTAIIDGNYAQIFQYHSFWHVIVAGISLLFQIPSITVMAWLGPLLLVTMGLSFYYFNQRYFGKLAGIASLILIGFFSRQPLQTLYDGGFPNVLAAGTFLPLVFIALERAFSAKHKAPAISLFLFSLILLSFTHHLTTLYTIATILLFFCLQFIRKAHNQGKSLFTIGTWIIGAAILSIPVLGWLLNGPLPKSIRTLATAFIQVNWQFPFVHFVGKLDNPDAIWPLSTYPNGIGEAVFILGIAGLVVITINLFTRRLQYDRTISLLLIAWIVVLFISSRIASLGFPVRLARDLAIPLGLLGGVFIQWCVAYIRERQMPGTLVPLFLLACLLPGWQTFSERLMVQLKPNSLIYHLPVDSRAAEYITKELPLSAKIVVFQDDIYLSSFTPLHQVTWDVSPSAIQKLATPRTAHDVLIDYDYVYVEYRRDRPEGWLNNPSIIKDYRDMEFARETASFTQSEKDVYLFAIDHTKLR